MVLQQSKLIVLALGIFLAMASGTKDLDRLLTSSESFSINLFSEIRKKWVDNNVAISPASLQPVLAMLEMGARGNTKKQLSQALFMPEDRRIDWAKAYSELDEYLKDPVFLSASAIFYQDGYELMEAFNQKVSMMGASINKVDFTKTSVAVSAVNDWCNAHTNGKIPRIVESSEFDGSPTALLIANALYFKADWKIKFDRELTEEDDFHSPSGTIKVPMMSVKSTFKYYDHPTLKAKVLSLPYKSGKFSMIFILPNENSNLDEVQQKLARVGLKNVWKTLKYEKVDVKIPKFKIESDLDLEGPLKSMGITDAFDEKLSNLMGMLKTPGIKLYVQHVKQKVFIEVNEEGTEAAAATGAQLTVMSAPIEERIVFYANRPFAFVLVAGNNELKMFVGTVTKPT